MVILETAAVGAAGYGLYKGGDAAVRKGKEVQKEFKREQKRSGQRSELASKQKERSERLARITDIRNNGTATQSSHGLTGWMSSSRQAKPPPAAAASKKDNDVNERLQNVLQKLDTKPKKEKKGLMGMFKKK